MIFCKALILAATVTIGDREFPTYPYSEPDPVPAPEKFYWPYVRHDGTTDKAVTQKWRTVTLESDRLKVTMMPDVGGKVWGAVDKLTGREFIYFNHAVKFRDIATCGPWCSGGIEFNFGVFGHSPTTAAPVKWSVRENSDGSVSYFCGDCEKICGTTWQVEVQLKDGEDAIGNSVRVKVVKNKVAPPFRKAEFDIMFGEGISRVGEIIDLGVEMGIIKKSGSWFSYGDTKLAQGRDAVKRLLSDNPELSAELEAKIMASVNNQEAE